MFMTALFSNPTLAATHMEPKPVVPSQAAQFLVAFHFCIKRD